MSPLIDSLYAIIDAEAADGPLGLTFQALNAGCAVVQLRAKSLDDVAFLEIAKRMRSACTHAAVSFVINDRADIARLVRADGLPQETQYDHDAGEARDRDQDRRQERQDRQQEHRDLRPRRAIGGVLAVFGLALMWSLIAPG